MNYNKNVIHDIIHSSVDTIRRMEQDSKNFRESVKNNAPLTNSKTLPTSAPTTNAEPSAYSIEQIQFYLSNLTQHLTIALNGLDPHYNLRISTNDLGIPIQYIPKCNSFRIKLFKIDEKKELTYAFFTNQLCHELNRRCELVYKNAQQTIKDAYNIYTSRTSRIMRMNCSDETIQSYWMNRLYDYFLEYQSVLSRYYIFLNTIRFYQCIDWYDCIYLDFRLALC